MYYLILHLLLSFLCRFLDLSFNLIRVIEGLSTLTGLTDLYLINNKITVIDGLQTLTNLTMLELGSNRLRVREIHMLIYAHAFIHYICTTCTI